jgi:hypothetical protein
VDREAAEAAEQEALGARWAAEHDLAQLYLLTQRMAIKHMPEIVRDQLLDLLRDEIDPLAEAVARLERRQ